MPIDMERLYGIESSGDPKAYNKKSKATGLGQVTPIVVEEWNNFHPKRPYTLDSMYDPNANKEVSNWYMQERIPAMLKFYKLPVNDETMLWAYNAGIGNVKKGIKPKETIDYINKYNRR